MSKACHTILLVRPDDSSPNNSTYCDFDSVDECLETVCFVYEEHLRRHKGNKESITYSLEELYVFIDSFLEMNILIQEEEGESYVPHTTQWIKDQLFQMLGEKLTKKK